MKGNKFYKWIVIGAALLSLITVAGLIFVWLSVRNAAPITIQHASETEILYIELRELIRDEYAMQQAMMSTVLVVAGFLITFLAVVVPIMIQRERTQELKAALKRLKTAIKNSKDLQEKLDTAETQLETQRNEITATKGLISEMMQELAEKLAEFDEKHEEKHKQRAKEFEELKEQVDVISGIKTPEGGSISGLSAMTQGNDEFKKGNYKRALGYYEIATGSYKSKDESQNLALAYYNASKASWRLEKYEKALGYINEAIKIDDSDANYYNLQGIILRRMKRYSESLEYLNKAILIKPNNAIMYQNRAITLHDMKHYKEALVDRNRAIELNPENADYYYNRAITLYNMERYKDTLADDDKAIELEPNNAKYYDSRALTYKELAEATDDPEKKAEYERLAKKDEETAKKICESENKGETP